jgi:hypothetical protein
MAHKRRYGIAHRHSGQGTLSTRKIQGCARDVVTVRFLPECPFHALPGYCIIDQNIKEQIARWPQVVRSLSVRFCDDPLIFVGRELQVPAIVGAKDQMQRTTLTDQESQSMMPWSPVR